MAIQIILFGFEHISVCEDFVAIRLKSFMWRKLKKAMAIKYATISDWISTEFIFQIWKAETRNILLRYVKKWPKLFKNKWSRNTDLSKEYMVLSWKTGLRLCQRTPTSL